MIFSYGNYQHAENEVTVNINMRGLENQTGYVYGVAETWVITGILQADSLAALLAKQSALQSAYQLQDQNVLWRSGSDVVYQIQSSQTLYGVRVVNPPSFAQGAAPGELVNRRQYQITLEAAYLFDIAAGGTIADPYILDYEQSLSFTGNGGPTFGHLPTITGLHQKQILTESSIVTCQQSGSKVSLNAYAIPDPPLEHLADYEKQDRRVFRQGNPRRINNYVIEYPIFWTYTFERNQPFPTAT
ncbi:hypothetical protein [uncultured Gimesia sp.]|uniref:hypothetical protein n=1 Tax=uncultured Gimesia sp. TaxID=1678688 RepID=UPI0030DB9487|tara:strand:+ start:99582 stop:100313 length:732 start_codon:yes stop_codon:yes gene_type:complete